jgi:hypothetical protein
MKSFFTLLALSLVILCLAWAVAPKAAGCPCEAALDTEAKTVSGLLLRGAEHYSVVMPAQYAQLDTLRGQAIGQPFDRVILVIDITAEGQRDTLGYLPLD